MIPRNTKQHDYHFDHGNSNDDLIGLPSKNKQACLFRTIFVDAPFPCVPKKNWPRASVCHLFCSVGRLGELHLFAQSIGINRCWFHSNKRKGTMPHYDITPVQRILAISRGVREAERLQVVAAIRAGRAFRSASVSL